jgi:HTH-type transcriptional regulator/antitoxin HigA
MLRCASPSYQAATFHPMAGRRRPFRGRRDPRGSNRESGPSDGELEVEANRFAANLLIPPDEAEHLKDIETRGEIIDLASKLKIPAGIIVGRMQREGYLGWHQHNDLRRRFVLTES